MQFHLHSVIEHSLLLRRSTTHSVACKYKNPSLSARCLAMRRLPHYLLNARIAICCLCEKTPSLSAERSLYRHEKTPSPSAVSVRRLPHYLLNARCIAVRRLHHHLLSLWEDSLTICWTLVVSPWEDSIAICCLCEETPSLSTCCLAMGRLHRHPLFSRCVSIRRLPVGRLPMHLWTLSYIAFSHFSIIRLSRSYSSGNVWYTRKFYLSHTGMFSWSVPLTQRQWHSGCCDVWGFTGCIRRGIKKFPDWTCRLECMYLIYVWAASPSK